MRLPSRISARLLLFNLLVLFLPAAGLIYFDVSERQLLRDQERAMVQQGRLLAAALSGRPALDPAEAREILARLAGRTEARLRVVDPLGAVLADSSASPPAARSGVRYDPSDDRENLLYRGGASLVRLWRRLVATDSSSGAARPREAAGGPLLPPEVRAALAGRYGAATRVVPGRRSLTLSIAIPVRGAGGEAAGAVLVSQSTARVLAALVEVRLGIFQVFLASLAAAIALTLLMAGTISRPLTRLRDEARALVDRRGRLRGSFRGSDRRDEIGDLARALEELTRRLAGHLAFAESFAADVSHEFKNPLAGIRSAAELLGEVEDPADRERFVALVLREVARMEGLLGRVREITEIDARLEVEPAAPVDLGRLLADLAEVFRLRAGKGVRIELRAVPGVAVRAAPERLHQLFGNLVDNALGFSPEGGTVVVDLALDGDEARVRVEDEGPGIPEAHLGRIFDRFFRWRPDAGERQGHAGLGLAIARAIAEGYGGSIAVSNLSDRSERSGARFEVRLPALPQGQAAEPRPAAPVRKWSDAL